MRRKIIIALAAVVLGAAFGSEPAEAGTRGLYKVAGVEADDMLKMRAGAGIGYRVIVGLPNGTVLRIHSCELIGGTSWCKVSLKEASALRGYVSQTYLREL